MSYFIGVCFLHNLVNHRLNSVYSQQQVVCVTIYAPGPKECNVGYYLLKYLLNLLVNLH